jgi:hypothetical protein
MRTEPTEIDRLRERQQRDYEYLLHRLQMLEAYLKIKYTQCPRYEQAKSEQEEKPQG